jgi:fatty-acyl-CoA synthase
MTAPIDNLSQVAGDTAQPLIERTIHEVFAQTAREHGERDGAIFCAQNVHLSYAELSRRVDRLAAGFHALGLRKGDRIGIWSPNRLEWLLTQFATARLGLVMVNINPAYRLAELEFALNKVGCKALVTATRFKTSDYIAMLETLAPELASSQPGALEAAKLPSLETVIQMGEDDVAGMFGFEQVIAAGEAVSESDLDAITANLDCREPINIQFTSGTTGTPKGATLTHRNILNNAYFVSQLIELGETDRLCIPVPLYHCFGMVMGSLACAVSGAAMVFPSEVFEPGSTLAAVQQERCTALYGVPTMFVAELQHADFAGFDLSSLRTGIMAGSPCPIEVMRRVVSDMNMAEVSIAYGMTETSPVSFQSSPHDSIDKRVTTVGRIHPHVEAKVVDEAGRTVPVGSDGEICTRGYLVMAGYWDDEERTREAIDDEGWMHTGDLGRMDEEGFLNIVGRVKDMVIRGGENLFPKEIEDFLYRHPKIQAVQVFGIPDEKFGEELCAWIMLKPDESANDAEIRAFCEDQIAHFKIPRHIRFVDELPLTVTGKPQKFKMREAMIEELKLRELKTA